MMFKGGFGPIQADNPDENTQPVANSIFSLFGSDPFSGSNIFP
jgi:hypothetical protein